MPSIKPFKGVVYDKKKVKGFDRVVAPPYDVIPPKMQDELYKKNPHNIVRLILGKIQGSDTVSSNRYTRAEKYFKEWLKKGIMVEGRQDALYIYEQIYTFDNHVFKRIGFIGLMRLNLGRKRTVLPHENTLKAPKIDRLNLIRRVRANLSPIFILYEDKARRISGLLAGYCRKRKPLIDIKFEGVRHRVWRLEERPVIRKIQAFMRGKNTFIADGHHRYEVAVKYALELKDKALPSALKNNSKYMMAYFAEFHEKSLTILPTHRLVKDAACLDTAAILKRLERFFAISKVEGIDSLVSRMRGSKNIPTYGMLFGKGESYVIKLKDAAAADSVMRDKPKEWRRLDVSILHKFVLENILGIKDDESNIEYLKDPFDVASSVLRGKCKIAFLLNPTKVLQVKRIAQIGERMPRKATYFYPKPLSGLVINKLD